jgi:2-methylisocitrate lyase-like PEP mutase family enzyme
MNERVSQFTALHHQASPLLIGNVWNAQSAQVFEKLKFNAIATSSAAVAATLGYPDGEAMSFAEYLQVVKGIARATSLPLSVDLEAGYGKTADEVAANVKQLAAIGVMGVNIEDSLLVDGKRVIVDGGAFAGKLQALIENLKASNTAMFINVRCDAFLLGLPDATNEAVTRAKLYDKTGAHGLFFPCVTKLDDVKAVVQSTTLPINVMCMPGLPSFQELKSTGVKRISMGNFLNAQIYQALEDKVARIVEEGDFKSLF